MPRTQTAKDVLLINEANTYQKNNFTEETIIYIEDSDAKWIAYPFFFWKVMDSLSLGNQGLLFTKSATSSNFLLVSVCI